jgi:hypothetical protein
MKWREIRKHYPQQWLLVEAIKAHSEAKMKIRLQDGLPYVMTSITHHTLTSHSTWGKIEI